MQFEEVLNNILDERDRTLWEGMILNVNTLISNCIGVPEGQYSIILKDSDTCQLIPTSEATNQKQYEVLRPTLAGFFNPEVHRRVVIAPTGKFIAEARSRKHA